MMLDRPRGPNDTTAGRLLQEQIGFYEADAVPYDRWLASLADDTNSTKTATAARARSRQLAEWFARVAPLGDVVEIAAGTGRVSELIAPHAARLVLLDSSPSSLALAADKLVRSTSYAGSACMDIFDWRPPRRFDTVVFAAWLHHIPDAVFDEFWHIVDAATEPDGRVLFDVAVNTSAAHLGPPPKTPSIAYAAYHDPTRGISVRDLDGRRWTVVHQTWDTEILATRLGSLGWQLSATGPADESFEWATARRRR